MSLLPRGALAWTLTVLGGLSCLPAAVTFYFALVPESWTRLAALGVQALLRAPELLVPSAVALVLTIAALRSGAMAGAIGWALTALLLGGVALGSLAANWRRASAYGAQVSVAAALLPRFHGEPQGRRETRIYAVPAAGSELRLDHFRAQGVADGSSRPAVVRVHGGAWNHGGRGDLPLWNEWLASLGFDVFDIEYRLPPPARYLDEIGDVKCALGWVVDNAASYHVDPERVSLFGHSAGANLALLAAYSAGDARLPPSCPVRVVKPRAVVNAYGPVDLARLYETTPSPSSMRPLLAAYLGGSLAEKPERYALVSPVHYVRAESPPTFTLHGEVDRVVPLEQAALLDRALGRQRVPHEMVTFPWSDHAFDVVWNSLATQAARAKLQAFLERYAR
ncbi:MAG TPA: alpha/beta hydrolase [Polyangiaceae bacterium]|jgi:acetyl esterase/lipase|nr:alpha/beta hydrolase [Polyangiaceae bacterium]